MSRPRTPEPLAPAEGAPVTVQDTTLQLQDPEDTAAFLLYRLHTTTGKAREAFDRAQSAAMTARGHEQTVAQLDAAKKELTAKLDAVHREIEAATAAVKHAYAEHEHHMAEHHTFAKRAEDTVRICNAAGVPTDAGLPAPATAPMVELDPTADEHMQRFNAAHDEQAATGPEPKL